MGRLHDCAYCVFTSSCCICLMLACIKMETKEVRNEGLESLPPNVKHKAEGLPIRSPKWPQNRPYFEVKRELAPKNGKSTDFIKTLPQGATMIEIGFGNGVNLSAIKKARPDVKTIGVSITSWAGNRVASLDEVYLQYVPDDLTLLKDKKGQADLVIDVFSAATYANNPFHALIYSAVLLKPGGRYNAITGLIDNAKDGLTAFGSAETQEAMVQFFKKHMNIDLNFEVTDLATSVLSSCFFASKHLLVYFEAPAEVPNYNYAELIKAADKEIGIPTTVKTMGTVACYSFKDIPVTSKRYIKESSQ